MDVYLGTRYRPLYSIQVWTSLGERLLLRIALEFFGGGVLLGERRVGKVMFGIVGE